MLPASNVLVLDGIVLKTPKITRSPSGITHWHFVLEHQSQQTEADLPRRAFLRIPVVVSGRESQQLSQALLKGNSIRANGFLSRHDSRDGSSKLVLHAQSIEQIS
ncbi:MAG: primosomal replication protein N [Phenylobacterium sp.]|jgi:primosomal replication protein N